MCPVCCCSHVSQCSGNPSIRAAISTCTQYFKRSQSQSDWASNCSSSGAIDGFDWCYSAFFSSFFILYCFRLRHCLVCVVRCCSVTRLNRLVSKFWLGARGESKGCMGCHCARSFGVCGFVFLWGALEKEMDWWSIDGGRRAGMRRCRHADRTLMT